MKGVVLAGGLGTRLRPLTSVINKHLLPVGPKPMLFWPLEMLAEAGIDEVMVVVGGQSTEEIMKLCGNGKQWGFKSLYYAYQEGEGGIAAALALAEGFVGTDHCCVVLGDNLMLGDSLKDYATQFIWATLELDRSHDRGAMVLLAQVPDPENYGVATMDAGRIIQIIEKPKVPKSVFGVIGVYFYSPDVFDKIRECRPSKRNELEITDVNNLYAKEGRLRHRKTHGKWIDAGSSIEAWVNAGKLVEEFKKSQETITL